MARVDRTGDALRLESVLKRFSDHVAVDHLSLAVAHGEFLTLLGPSGCGKTTTLNLIAGFFAPTSGSIYLDGQSVEDLPPFRRDTGMVFQDYALFPHMTVEQNIAFGLRMRKVAKEDIGRRVGRALELVRLSGLGARRPAELSGGQRQRVALARALVIEPAVLLFDEPLSNLDLKLRESMRIEITAIQRELGITAVYVTHDQGEALVMSDRIALMNRGRIEQIGSAADIYEAPRTPFVAEFIGSMNMLPAELLGAPDADGLGHARTRGGIDLPVRWPQGATAGAATLAVRPERCRIAAGPEAGAGEIVIAGTVTETVYLGSITQYHLAFAGGEGAVAEVHNAGPRGNGGLAFRRGDMAYLKAAVEDVHVLPG